MAEISFSDALDVRVSWALLQIDHLAWPEREFDLEMVGMDLEIAVSGLGRRAYPDFEVPLLIADVAQLVCWFEGGFREAALDDEISECAWCNDGTGNPCPIHD